jgi:elongation of very long chain fatty acids protein 7
MPCSPFTFDLISFLRALLQILGPKIMEKRKPFKLRKIIVTYNLLQAVFSFYLFFEGGRIAWFARYNWRCEAVDFSNDYFAIRVITLTNLIVL